MASGGKQHERVVPCSIIGDDLEAARHGLKAPEQDAVAHDEKRKVTNRHPTETPTEPPDQPSMSRTQVLCLGVATFVAGWAGEWLFDWTWRFGSGVFLLAWVLVFLVMRRVK